MRKINLVSNELLIEEIAKKYQLNCRVYHETVFVHSLEDEWVIKRDYKTNKFVLSHRNKGRYSNHEHLQKDNYYRDIEEVFKAIVRHDKYYNNHRYRHNKRTRLTKLFEQVESKQTPKWRIC